MQTQRSQWSDGIKFLEQMLGAYNADAAIMEAQPISAGQTFSIADNNGTMTGISVVGQDTMGNWSVLMEGSREPVSVSDDNSGP